MVPLCPCPEAVHSTDAAFMRRATAAGATLLDWATPPCWRARSSSRIPSLTTACSRYATCAAPLSVVHSCVLHMSKVP